MVKIDFFDKIYDWQMTLHGSVWVSRKELYTL